MLTKPLPCSVLSLTRCCVGTSCWGRLVDVYDGDTVKVVLPFGGKLHKFNVRLAGIDTAEMRSKDAAVKERAVRARDRLLQHATGLEALPKLSTKKDINKLLDDHVTMVWVECLGWDKYGRLLANLFSAPGATRSFAQQLLDEKLAYEYFGETKLTEAEQDEILK